eukprot:753722-Hanusia_phi.AAC.1
MRSRGFKAASLDFGLTQKLKRRTEKIYTERAGHEDDKPAMNPGMARNGQQGEAEQKSLDRYPGVTENGMTGEEWGAQKPVQSKRKTIIPNNTLKTDINNGIGAASWGGAGSGREGKGRKLGSGRARGEREVWKR